MMDFTLHVIGAEQGRKLKREVFCADFELLNFKICSDENFDMKLGKFSFSDIYMFSRF